MKGWRRWVGLAVGVGLFGWYLKGAEPLTVVRQVGEMGWRAPLLLLPYLVVYVVDAWAWRRSFAVPPRVSFWVMLRIRWCGESVNNLIPTAYVGGEALKVMLLARHGVPTAEGTAAALVSKTAQTVAQVLFLALGSAAFLASGVVQPGLRSAMATVLVGGVLVVVVLFWWQRRGVFTSLLGLSNRLGIRWGRLEKRRGRLLEMDRTIAGFYREQRGVFVAATGWYLLGWLLDSVEIWLTSRWLGMPLGWKQAVAIESFVGVVKVVGMWVPGALGVQESGIVALVRMAGGGDRLGATYALIRRARELVYAGVGWGMLMVGGGAPRAEENAGSAKTPLASERGDGVTSA